MTNFIKTAVAATLLLSGAAWAERPNSLSENRGFAACVEAAESRVRSVKVHPTFYLNTYADSRQFYLNGNAVMNGEWRPVRVACETDRKGYKVLALRVQEGQFAPRFTGPVAQN